MPKNRTILTALSSLLLLTLASEQSLKAYTDPGSGTMFVQIILAGVIGGLFRIRSLINRFRKRKSDRISA
jgi:hypothetical protein